MTISGVLLRLINKSSFLINKLKAAILEKIGEEKFNRRINTFYNKLDYSEKTLFHHLFSKIFRDNGELKKDTEWKVRFINSQITIPISKENAWLNWDTALSILGHDTPVKQFYSALLKSDLKPNSFFDIGANYGTHTVLMESQGIQSHAFEPNIKCKPFFEAMLKANGLSSQFHNIALGEEAGSAQLSFPENDTWLGSISTYSDESSLSGNVLVDIETNTLDAFCESKGLKPELIKIDTEGYEIHVLIGGLKTIEKYKPLLVFETNKEEERKAIADELNKFNYSIFSLVSSLKEINISEFIKESNNNFLAAPKDKIDEIILLNSLIL